MNAPHSHMPFLTEAPSGERVLFFCRPVASGDDPVVWKLHVQCADREPFRLHTGFCDKTIECSPAAWHDETGWHVSFVAGGGPGNPAYHMYRMDGVSLQRLSPPVAMKMSRVGFIHRNRLVSGDKSGNIFVYGTSDDQVLELPRMELLRLSYKAEKPDVLLITCRWPEEEEICTVAYDLQTGAQHFLETDGQAVYKPTILGNELLHAVRVGEDFEERQICHAKEFDLKPCKIVSLRPASTMPLVLPNIESPDQVRVSDLKSVEKHLGAAFVLASEIANGHAYRMRFVGHLHEAEDESQSHPALHRQIRKMRKNYQKSGMIPDWDLLAKSLYEAMDDS